MCGFLNAYMFKCILLNARESAHVYVSVSVNVNMCVGCKDLFFLQARRSPRRHCQVFDDLMPPFLIPQITSRHFTAIQACGRGWSLPYSERNTLSPASGNWSISLLATLSIFN